MSYLKNYLSWLISAKGNMEGWRSILFFFLYVNNPCVKCEESFRILKIIYHGLISAIENMDGWQNIFFFM